MLSVLFLALELLAVLTALLASWLWYAAGRRPLRRISRFEQLDAADINRLVVAINRTGTLNRKAALAAAASAACLALHITATLIAS